MSFQLIDDVLDFVGTSAELGKPAANDLRQGIVTAPVLFAADEFPEIRTYINSKFSNERDVQKTLDLIDKSKGITKTIDLAKDYCQKAIDSLMLLPDTKSRTALIDLIKEVTNRTS